MQTKLLSNSNAGYMSLDYKDWKYEDRRSMQEIVQGVFLGSYGSSRVEQLRANQITHVVCVRSRAEAQCIRPRHPAEFHYVTLDIVDRIDTNILQFFDSLNRHIDRVRAEGGRLLVHGNLGISRSAALVIAYVMQSLGLDSANALCLVQQRRFCVNPNEGFMRQLMEYEAIYRAAAMYPAAPTTSVNMLGGASLMVVSAPKGMKRAAETDEDTDDDELGGYNFDGAISAFDGNSHLTDRSYFPGVKQFRADEEDTGDIVMMS